MTDPKLPAASSDRGSPAPRKCISRRLRRGATTVEFALTVGIVFALFTTAFEFCRMSMIRHMVDNAVYESARRAIVPGATAADVQATANRFLNTLGVRAAEITISPTTITDATPSVTIRIRVPFNQNSLLPPAMAGQRAIERTLTMSRERSI